MDFKITIDHPEQNKMEVMGGVTAPRCAQYGITFVIRVISKVININIKGIKTILILLYDVTKIIKNNCIVNPLETNDNQNLIIRVHQHIFCERN